MDRSADRLHVSPRQREVLLLLASGLTDKEIARALHISERTVETYLGRLYEKTGIHRRAGLVAFWLRQEGTAVDTKMASPSRDDGIGRRRRLKIACP